jgi:lipid-binding SYLF domain-containing protein
MIIHDLSVFVPNKTHAHKKHQKGVSCQSTLIAMSFSYKPKYSDDVVDDLNRKASMFGNKHMNDISMLQGEDGTVLLDDSPLPSSALPYIYPSSRTHTEVSITPEKNDYSMGLNETHKNTTIPNASDTVKQAYSQMSNNNVYVETSYDSHTVSPVKLSPKEQAAKWDEYKDTVAKEQEQIQSMTTNFTVRVTSSVPRTDASGKAFTSYTLTVDTDNGKYDLEHRYSDFQKLYKDLKLNGIILKNKFPEKSIFGRIGDFTPASRYAPEREKEMIRNREFQLDTWMKELCERFQNDSDIHGELRSRIEIFLQKSSTTLPPCDRENYIDWDGFLEGTKTEGLMKRGSNVKNFVGNPVAFSMATSIRQAATTLVRMCGTKSTVRIKEDQSDQTIPLDLLQQAKGLVFLTVAKAGFVISCRVGTGILISRRRDASWSPPVAIGTVGMGWGFQAGGDITNFLIVLNTESAVKMFASKRHVALGTELGIAVGPLGRGVAGNLGTGGGKPAPAYAWAHSKGLFAGISFEGSIITIRSDMNANFYGRPIEANELLFETRNYAKAAKPLYDALDEVMRMDLPDKGFRPSHMISPF